MNLTSKSKTHLLTALAISMVVDCILGESVFGVFKFQRLLGRFKVWNWELTHHIVIHSPPFRVRWLGNYFSNTKALGIETKSSSMPTSQYNSKITKLFVFLFSSFRKQPLLGDFISKIIFLVSGTTKVFVKTSWIDSNQILIEEKEFYLTSILELMLALHLKSFVFLAGSIIVSFYQSPFPLKEQK